MTSHAERVTETDKEGERNTNKKEQQCRNAVFHTILPFSDS